MTQVPELNINFPKEEEKVLQLWKELDAFATTLKQSKGKPKYSFYDGPPFATGLPHYGHILAGTIKDIVTRWAHGRGFHVERRFGWDTHGLPVEYEIDKKLGIKGPEDVEKMGIKAYNAECRSIVTRYSSEWEEVVGRMGRWIDFKNDYKSMYPWYMESIWWVFKQLFDKGLIYKGFRVMPYSTGCATPLSNFEVAQNYKDVVDPAVMVSFPLDEDPGVSLVAWTTTPWTLPSNLALCLHPDLIYVKIEDVKTGAKYIVMEVRVSELYKKPDMYKVLDKMPGSKLKGKTYKPLFPYFEHMKPAGAFKVLNDGYVTEDSGTGVVHQAPFFGEDDNRVCLAHGVIIAGGEVVCPLDGAGRFTAPVTDFQGQYVKDADKNIIKHLKEAGRLVNASTVKHSYPFCWRSETPLIYRAIPAWFMRVSQMNDRLLDRNNETYWVPDTVREGRFANWLENARDWNISRNRYWGTPMPIWMSEDGEEVVCIGSVEELHNLSGVKVEDLHREFVDDITIPSKRPGQPPLKRISEVFDCWFESGSMPYAQAHYPFENKKEFEDSFPADFIAEGIDQTRGWFYTLLVISTALFNRPPFKNLIVNGLVLASDGTKMSKRLKNYPPPIEVVDKYGADAVRLFLINSPVVKAENLRFREDGVLAILKDVFLPWYNAFRFLLQNIDLYEREEGVEFTWGESSYGGSDNVMDKWIISFTQSLLDFVAKEMAAYRLYTVLPRLIKFIDNLTNWYVRMNRKRLKGEGGAADCKAALDSLFSVLITMVRVMAPFTPFLTEMMYQVLKKKVPSFSGPDYKSVHYLMLPTSRSDLIHEDIERAVARMQSVVDLGRVLRDRKTMPIKYPLPEVVIIHKDATCLADLKSLEKYILEELNVKALTLSGDKASYGVTLRAEPDHKTLGLRLKGAFKAVMAEIKTLKDETLTKFVDGGELVVQGHKLEAADIRIMYSFAGEKAAELSSKYEADSCEDILVMLDTTPDESMLEEGIAREVVNRIQKFRKSAGLKVSDEVTMYYSVVPTDHSLTSIIVKLHDYIQTSSKTPLRLKTESVTNITKVEKFDVKGAKLELNISPGFPADYAGAVSNSATDSGDSGQQPASDWLNLELVGCQAARHVAGGAATRAGILLTGQLTDWSIERLTGCAQDIFGLHGVKLDLYYKANKSDKVENLKFLKNNTVYVFTPRSKAGTASQKSGFNCKFLNVSKKGGETTSLLLENPVGCPLDNIQEAMKKLKISCLYKDETKKSKVNVTQLNNMAGLTLYA